MRSESSKKSHTPSLKWTNFFSSKSMRIIKKKEHSFISWSFQVLSLLLTNVILTNKITVQKRETQDYKGYPVSDSTMFLNWVSQAEFRFNFIAELCKPLNITFYSIICRATANQVFYYVGLKYSTPTIACALTNVLPAATFVLAVLFR